jgi:protein SCO1/2
MLAGFAIAAAGPSIVSAKTVTIGGPFELIASDGSTVTDADFRGDWLLVFFGYTFCPDLCPTTLATVTEALDELGPDAERLRPIFISVDPNRDTPEVLGAYTAAFDPRIVGLTGAPERIAAVADAYRAHYRSHQIDAADAFYAVDHSAYLYIMDPDGAFVRAMDARAPSAEIAGTVRAIMRR